MAPLNEKQTLKKLGIDAWDKLSREKFGNYIHLIPKVDKEVRLKILEQLPEILTFTTELVQTVVSAQRDITQKNHDTTSEVISALESILKSLDQLSQRPELTFEQIQYICDKQVEIAHLLVKLDENNKNFLVEVLKGVAGLGIAALAVIAVVFGAKELGDGG
ncbi:MAG: hypothetical protein LBN30_02630 [Oscillospiraceae bacterium]|nr:hypothetical protein [Oscillospiraceae bacterium]